MTEVPFISPPIVSVQTLKERKSAITPKDYGLKNQSWASISTQEPMFSYSKNDTKQIPIEIPIQYNNEHNPSPEETSIYAGKIESATILKFLEKSQDQKQDDFGYSLTSISSTTTYRPIPKPIIEFTENYQKIFYSFLKISMHPIYLQGSRNPLSDYEGILFLYNTLTKISVSEQAYFKYKQGKVVFNGTDNESVIFKVRNNNENIVLVCILMKCEKPNDEAISAFTPYATSFAPLNKEGDAPFDFSWLILDQTDSLTKIGMRASESDPTIMLIGKINIKKMKDIEPEECCTTANMDNSKTLVLMNMPSEVIDKTNVITLTSLVFTFNSVPDVDYTYFKVFLCDKPTDIANPKGLTGFISTETKAMSNCYVSTMQKPGKEIYFPDTVRFYPQSELPKTTHLIIQFIQVKGKSNTVYKDAVIELFNDERPIQPKLFSYHTNQVKNLSGDYIAKSKTGGRSICFASIDMPPNYYPPTQFAALSEAFVPEQVQWKDICETDKRTLKKHILPVFIKLVSIIAPATIVYIVELLSLFEGDSYVKNTIRSWIYNCFDPKTIKTNFLSAFTNALNQFIQSSLENNFAAIKNIISNFDIFSSMILVSFLNKSENYIPKSLLDLFATITKMEANILDNKPDYDVTDLSYRFGYLIYVFTSLIEAGSITKIINFHIRTIIHCDNSVNALKSIFEFLIPFTRSTDFIVYYATRLKVVPLNTPFFSPFQATFSLIFLAIGKSLTLNDYSLIKICCDFIAHLTFPIEDLKETTLKYRIGFMLFPLFDILSATYETVLKNEERKLLIPTVLFLLGYIPHLQMVNFFRYAKKSFRVRILNFISLCATLCIEQLTPVVSVFNMQLNELTKRCLMFLAWNINEFGSCIQEAVKLASIISTSSYQIPHNYLRIFIVVSQLIQKYPCQRLLINSLLSMLAMKQHLARCFAVSLIILFFKADFNERGNVVVSSAEVLDELTSLMLHQPTEMIPLYELALNRINEHSSFFRNESFTEKVKIKLESALNIAEVIKEMRRTLHNQLEKCVYVMKIANQYFSYPSMRMKWLSEIVSINIKNSCYSAAFVAQLHICALISTVIEHEQRIIGGGPTITPPKQHNLLVCQPVTYSRPTEGVKIQLYNTDYEFIPSVLVETKIDFESVNDDFKFISSDFTLDLLKDALNKAIEYGEKAQLYYSLRCVRSIQMRFFIATNQNKELAQCCRSMGSIFKSLSANVTPSYDVSLVFFASGENIFCLDHKSKVEGIAVYPHETNRTTIEHSHAWSVFRTDVNKDLIPNVKNADSKELSMTRYTVEEALPRYTNFSKITEVFKIDLSLREYADLETKTLCLYMQQYSEEFERCFPFRTLTSSAKNSPHINIESDLDRVVSLVKAVYEGKNSLFGTLNILRSKGGEDTAHSCAEILRDKLQRLLKVYKRAIEYLQSKDHYSAFTDIINSRHIFTSDFGLPDIDTRGYEGIGDPITDKINYE